MPSAVLAPSFNAYRTLGLPSHPAHAPSPQDIKAAYRRALLTHHPDKAGGASNQSNGSNSGNGVSGGGASGRAKCTVDEITRAYRVLSSPAERAEHDRALRLRASGLGASRTRVGERGGEGGEELEEEEEEEWRLGLEVLDLDDLGCDEEKGEWWRSCRCGLDRGFVVDEEQLEKGADLGEVLVGCLGCSLWVRVCFAVAGEGEEDGEEGKED